VLGLELGLLLGLAETNFRTNVFSGKCSYGRRQQGVGGAVSSLDFQTWYKYSR